MKKYWNQIQVAAYLEKEQIEELKKESKETGKNISELIREKAERFFTKNKKEQKFSGRPKEDYKKIAFYLSEDLVEKVKEYSQRGRSISEIFREKILKKS